MRYGDHFGERFPEQRRHSRQIFQRPGEAPVMRRCACEYCEFG